MIWVSEGRGGRPVGLPFDAPTGAPTGLTGRLTGGPVDGGRAMRRNDLVVGRLLGRHVVLGGVSALVRRRVVRLVVVLVDRERPEVDVAVTAEAGDHGAEDRRPHRLELGAGVEHLAGPGRTGLDDQDGELGDVGQGLGVRAVGGRRRLEDDVARRLQQAVDQLARAAGLQQCVGAVDVETGTEDPQPLDAGQPADDALDRLLTGEDLGQTGRRRRGEQRGSGVAEHVGADEDDVLTGAGQRGGEVRRDLAATAAHTGDEHDPAVALLEAGRHEVAQPGVPAAVRRQRLEDAHLAVVQAGGEHRGHRHAGAAVEVLGRADDVVGPVPERGDADAGDQAEQDARGQRDEQVGAARRAGQPGLGDDAARGDRLRADAGSGSSDVGQLVVEGLDLSARSGPPPAESAGRLAPARRAASSCSLTAS